MTGTRPLWIKICGIRTPAAALAARAAGADAVGFVFANSPRQIDPATARQLVDYVDPAMARVGIFVNTPLEDLLSIAEEARLTHVQLHGDESDSDAQHLRAAGYKVIRAVRVWGAESLAAAAGLTGDLLLLDTADPHVRGGTGRSFRWDLAADLARRRPIIVAGGLGPHNVGEAIRTVRPFGVDVSSGVERAPGEKDPARIASFISAARATWQAMMLQESKDRRKVMDSVRRAT